MKIKLSAFHNAVSKKEKKIKSAWFFLLLLFFASCQEEEKKTIVCWGDSLTAPHQETLKQKIRGIFVEDHCYPFILTHDVTINSKDCGLENFMGNTDVPACNICKMVFKSQL